MWFQKSSIFLHKKGLEISGVGGGSQRPKTLRKCMKLNWNFQRVEGGGGGGGGGGDFHGGMDIFKNHIMQGSK